MGRIWSRSVKQNVRIFVRVYVMIEAKCGKLEKDSRMEADL